MDPYQSNARYLIMISAADSSRERVNCKLYERALRRTRAHVRLDCSILRTTPLFCCLTRDAATGRYTEQGQAGRPWALPRPRFNPTHLSLSAVLGLVAAIPSTAALAVPGLALAAAATPVSAAGAVALLPPGAVPAASASMRAVPTSASAPAAAVAATPALGAVASVLGAVASVLGAVASVLGAVAAAVAGGATLGAAVVAVGGGLVSPAAATA